MARTLERNIAQKEPSSFTVGSYTFTNCQLIGGGTYGTVYKAYDIQQRTNFAIKVIRLDRYDFFIYLLLHLSHKLTPQSVILLLYRSTGALHKLYGYACSFSVKKVYLELVFGKSQF